jgi:multiple sugar transport system substrate-binding protein
MMKKLLLMMVLVLCLTALVFGGGNQAAGKADAQKSGTVNLRWALWDWDAVTYYKPLLEAYKVKNPNVNIEGIDLGYTDYPTAIATQLAGDSKIDIITIGDIPSYANLVKIGHLENLNTYVQRSGMDLKIFSGLTDELKINGGLYALPFRSDFWVTYYNKDLFDAAGVPYPTNDMTVQQYLDLAAKVTRGRGAEKVYGAHYHTWRSTVQLFGILDGKQGILDGTYDFIKPYYDLALKAQDDGVVMDYGTLKATNTHYSGVFYNNQLAMIHMGTWWVPTIIDKLKIGEAQCKNWGIVKFPHPEGVAAGTTLGTVTSVGVNARSTNKDAAWDFISFMAGTEGAQIVATSGTFPAVKNDAIAEIITRQPGFPQDENSKKALITVRSYLEMPISDISAQAEVILNSVHDAVMTKNQKIEDGIAQLNKEIPALGKK